MTLLALIIKILDLDLALTGFCVIGLFITALCLRWDRANPRVHRFLQADLFIFSAVALFAANLAYSFYFHEADPLYSIAHPYIRFVYELLGIIGFDLHIANSVWPSWSWPRKVASVMITNSLFVLLLFFMELKEWI
jgi:hypothetical protein